MSETEKQQAQNGVDEKGAAPVAKKAEPPPPAPPKEEVKSKGADDKPKEEQRAKAGDEPAKAQTRRVLREDDDEVPGDVELLELSPRALKSRLDRYSRRQLKELCEHFGVEDVEALKAKHARLIELEEKEEERRRSALDEKQRMQEDLDKQAKRASEAERRLLEVEERQVVREEDQRIKEIALEFIKAKKYKHVAIDLAEWLMGKSKAEVARMADKDIRAWFTSYVEENPEDAKDAQVGAGERPKVPFSNGADASRPQQQPSGQAGERTAKPGQPNSMSKAELRAAGYHW